jgi:hypothetical protein
MEKKKAHGGAGRGQGRKTREYYGLEPTVALTARIEPSVKEACIKAYGSIPNALRYAAEQAKNKGATAKEAAVLR